MSHRDILAIGGSLGALEAVKELCSSLPADLPAAVFLVVHVGAEGGKRLPAILGPCATLPVHIATDGEAVRPGQVYVAPSDCHLLVVDGTVRLGRGPRENMSRPAIDPLFRSVAMAYGPRAVGLVLTGLLNDGAAGLADMRRCGGVSVVQDPADADAPEMPLAALRASDVDYRAPLAELGPLLGRLLAEPSGAAVETPPDIRLEVEIALGRPLGSVETARLGKPVPLSCPACGGVMSEMQSRPPLRYRCQVGHGYTADCLAQEQEGSVDEAMRTAMRIIEERATLNGRMADDARHSGRDRIASQYEERAREYRAQADILRRAALRELA